MTYSDGLAGVAYGGGVLLLLPLALVIAPFAVTYKAGKDAYVYGNEKCSKIKSDRKKRKSEKIVQIHVDYPELE